ncbi:transcription factor 7-like 1 [Archocentrus centrarchus]|uniref:transcription factor 7-like 1 n=1 Tax=Archocentrus centrarchus TaxID=63155 RepID=UPI0011E9D5C5|nr:transcription factor 7-like 1 [Archocentrus centrarchus]
MDVREEHDRIVEQTDREGFLSTLEDIVLELLGPAVETTKPENPPPQPQPLPPPPPSFPAGPPQPAANSLAGGFGGWTLQGAGPPIIVQQVPSMAAPFTTVPAHLNSQPVTVSQGQNLLYQWPVNSVLTEATAAAVPLAAPSNPGNSVLKIPECMTRYLRPIGELNGMMVCDFATSPLPLNKPASKKRKRHEQEEGEDRLYVKKPPNAFMVYLEEQRPKVKAELTNSGSAAVNAVVAQRWKSLSRDQQEKYYKRAEEERILHAQKHPGWSSRDNYGKKKRTVQSSTRSTASALKSVQEAQQAKRASANVPVYGTFHLPHTKSQDLPASQASFLPHQLGSISSLTQTPALGMRAAPPSTSLAAFAGPTEPQSEAIFLGNTGEELLSHLENLPSTQPQEPFVHHSDSCTGREISADTAVDAPPSTLVWTEGHPSTLVCTPAASVKPTATVFSNSVEERLLSFLNNFPY